MGHTFSRRLYHIVFSTKERRALIMPRVRDRLFQYMSATARKAGARILRAGGTRDHVHLLATVVPHGDVAGFVGKVKANSSRWLRRTFPQMAGFGWQASYSSFSVSESARARVKACLESQQEHHRRRSFGKELAELLRRHGIHFDPAHYLD